MDRDPYRLWCLLGIAAALPFFFHSEPNDERAFHHLSGGFA